MSKIYFVMPAYNEAENIERVVNNLIENYSEYDYIVVNDTIDKCVEDTYNIIEAYHMRPVFNEDFINTVRQGLKDINN